MKKIFLIVVLVIGGVALYGKFYKEPHTRLEDALRNRWFSKGSNNTGMASAVDRVTVDERMRVKVYLSEDYRNLPGSQMECLRSIMSIVRTETVKGPEATVDFIYRNATIAKSDDGSFNVKMIQ